MLVGAFYYSHLRWTEESNLSRALYNSLYLPTLSPVTHRTLSSVNATPSVPPFNHLVFGRERKITEILHQEKMRNSKLSKDHRLGKKPKPSHNETKLEWLFENITNSESLDKTDDLDKTISIRTKNKTRLKEKFSEEALEIQLLDSLKGNISLLNNSDSGRNMSVLLGSPPKKNSSFIIAAIEENMQKIRTETEISLQRLSELSGYLKGSNSTDSKDAGALLRTVDDATHLEQNLGQQRDWILNLTNSVLDEKGDMERNLDGQQIIAKQIKELLQRSSTLEKLRLKYEAQRDMAPEEPVVSLENVMEKGLLKMHGGKSLTRQIAEMIGVSVPPKEPAPPATKIDGYYLIETRKVCIQGVLSVLSGTCSIFRLNKRCSYGAFMVGGCLSVV